VPHELMALRSLGTGTRYLTHGFEGGQR
jgi:hypothetical protein